MNKEQALSVLVTAVRIAQSKGVYVLEDAKVLLDAIQLLQPAKEEVPSPVAGKETTSKTTGTDTIDK